VEQHLVARLTLGPKVIGRFFLVADQSLNTGTDVSG